MLDLAYDEDSRADVDMNVVKTGDGRFIEVQGTAEGPPFERAGARRAARARRRRHPRARRAPARDSSATPAAMTAPGHLGRASLVIATTNPGKIREIAAILDGVPVELATLADFPAIAGARGDGRDVRRERAAQGALLRRRRTGTALRRRRLRHGDRRARQRCLASTRRAGQGTDYAVKFAKIRELSARSRLETSAARFVCRVALADRGRVVFESEGIVDGEIARAARHARLRLRPDLLLPAVQPHARRSPARREGDGQPSRPRLRGAPVRIW